MDDTQKIASILVDTGLSKPLDYSIPAEFLHEIKRGVQVKIPFRGKLKIGVVVDLKSQSEVSKTLPIQEIVSKGELITDDLFELALWMAKYYATPLSKVLKAILPATIRDPISHKEQYVVQRLESKEALREEYISLSTCQPAQAKVLEVMLMVKKEILLTELLEKANVSRSPVDTLVKNGFLSLHLLQIDRSPLSNEEYFKTKPKTLIEEQKKAFEKIQSSLEKNHFETHLLFGITGSGKTEIYLQAIEKALFEKKGALMLVPEISLTAQTIERFRSRFEDKIAILHHRLSQGTRFDEWHRIHRGEAKIVVGARSALFSPIKNLGLIIVDEEHDFAYKQTEEMPCYHARDVAVMRGKISKCPVILGSATPSLESFHNAKTGKYQLSYLNERPTGAKLPQVTIVDMKREFERQKGFTSFSGALIDGIKKRVDLGEQTILFLNRRGYHTSFLCQACGYTFKCPHCDMTLTFHLNENILSCHLCDYRLKPLQVCPECKKPETLKFKGVGTEQIERSLHAILPNVRTTRIDQDTTKHKGSHEVLFRTFRTGKSDVLIGTQMIAKGLHFPLVTLVAVLNSDSALQIPDFRASEQAYQLITQVAGRAGRSELKGEVILQTRSPENKILELASKQQFELFFEHEMASRKLFSYPPYTHFIKCLFKGLNRPQVFEVASSFRERVGRELKKLCIVHPLLPSGHPKVRDEWRFQFLIRGKGVYVAVDAIERVLKDFSFPKEVRFMIDVDPVSTFF